MIRLWPVIHLSTLKDDLANAKLANDVGAHGVFLIHMGGMDDIIESTAHAIGHQFPALNIGANYLTLPALDGMLRAIDAGMAASWSDNTGIRSDGVHPNAIKMAEKLNQLNGEHRHFGAVAFKYQQQDNDPAEAARRAIELGMTPTTSGSGTGQAPAIEKLKIIRNGIGHNRGDQNIPLACASGITPDNIEVIAPFLTDILVSTGISFDNDRFCIEKLTRLQKYLTQISTT